MAKCYLNHFSYIWNVSRLGKPDPTAICQHVAIATTLASAVGKSYFRQHTVIGGHAAAVVLCDEVGIVFGVDGVVVGQLQHLFEGVIDEDEADEGGEAFLRKSSEVLHQEACISSHQQETEKARP